MGMDKEKLSHLAWRDNGATDFTSRFQLCIILLCLCCLF